MFDRHLSRRSFLKGAALAAGGVAVGSSFLPATVRAAEEASGTVGVGLLNMLTGFGSIHAPHVMRAVQLAIQEINDGGGLLGKRVEVIVEDNHTDVDIALQRMTKLVQQDKVVATFAFAFSNIYHALVDRISGPMQHLTMNGSLNEGNFCNHYFFSTGAAPNQWIHPIVEWTVKNVGPEVYFVSSDYDWGRGSVAAAKTKVGELEAKVVGEDYYPLGTTDWSSAVQKISDANPKVLIPFVAGNDFVVFLKQCLEFGLKEKLAIGNTIFNEEDVPAFAPELRDGLLASNSYFTSLDSPANTKFLEALRANFGKDVIMTNFGEGFYCLAHMWGNAVKEAGTFDTEPVIKALEKQSFEGPQGKVSIDPKTHNATVHTYLAKVTAEGTFNIFADLGTRPPELVIPCEVQSAA
jgi:ABC-type branched-subunit amino acid transport system substrate-binding protein